MPAVSGLTINFGVNGNSLSYLGGGWARPEPRVTWAVGQESQLILPMTRGGREFVLTISLVPFLDPPDIIAQRVSISVDDTTIGVASISRPVMLAWRIPAALIRRSERTLLTLSHPDAAR